jgi:hypothetical protein
LGNELYIQESLPNASLVTIDQFIGDRIDSLHPCDKDQVTRTGANTPGIASGANCTRRIERLGAIGRW